MQHRDERNSDTALEDRIRRARTAVAASARGRVALGPRVVVGELPAWLGPYTLLRPLGAGAMGRVYEALDRKRNRRVALKIFHNTGPITAQLLKREFRALSGITHPNLVIFHDLCVRADICYFTMELVEGIDFVTYVRPSAASASPDRERLRSALKQLAEGVRALHQAQKVHRDLKPSNVVVTHQSGRVVVLDFGLITSVTEARNDATFSGQVVGTPAYMAPEQFTPQPVTPAADCYAIGGMLYHALVGGPPFHEVPPQDLAHVRATTLPKLPSHLAHDELGELCLELLHPDPRARADCAAVVARLSGAPSVQVVREARSPSSADRVPFLGRDRELQVLQDALRAAETGCVAVVVGGAPGVGKSTLIRRFLEPLDGHRYIVLTAKCHERESVPYKALDGIVDAVVRFAIQLPALEAASLLPRYALELMLMFPALGRIEAFAQAARRPERVLDGQEHKRRAIVALREMIARLADRARLVICAEDLHWGDHDSVGFIRQLLMSPDAPPCLCIGTARLQGGAEDVSAIVRRFIGSEHFIGSGLDVRSLQLNALQPADAQALARVLLRSAESAQAQSIARDSGGNPQLLMQLVAFAHSSSLPSPRANDASLADLLGSLITQLSPQATQLLRVMALAGGVVDQGVASAAAGLGEDASLAIQQLKAAQLIHTHGFSGHYQLELYHAQLARPVLKDLDPALLRELHARLAAALSSRGTREDERLIRHLRRAGRVPEAVAYLLECAERATKALAYERAAHLFALALKWGIHGPQLETVRLKRADALRSAGRGLEAAQAYLDVANAASDAPLGTELRCRAAQEFLLSGHLRAGRDIMPTVVSLPRGHIAALAALVIGRIALQLRGFRFRRREVEQVPAAELTRFDHVLSLAQTLLMVDPLLGRVLQCRLLRQALKLGEPSRVLRALCLEAVCRSARRGPRARTAVERILKITAVLNRDIKHPLAQATTTMWTAVSSYCMAEPERAITEAGTAEVILREESPAVAYEMATIHVVVLRAQMMLGHWNEFCRRAQDAIREALQRGNVYLSAALRAYTHMACLVVDDLDGSAREIEAARRDWPQDELHCQNLAILLGEPRTHLYRGNGLSAFRHLDELWPRLGRSTLLQFPAIRVELLALRGRAAALAYSETGLRRYRKIASDDAHRLLQEQFRGARGAGLLILGSAEIADKRLPNALHFLDCATNSFERDQLPFFAHLARYRAGLASQQHELVERSAAEIRRSGVRDCAAFTRMYTG